MLKSKRSLRMLAMMCALSMAVAGCSGSAPSSGTSSAPAPSSDALSASAAAPIELKVMHSHTAEGAATGDNNAAAIRRLTEEFFAKNPQYKLNETTLQVNDYETKIQAQAAVNDLPDVFMVKGSWIPNYVESGLLADLTGVVESSGIKDKYKENIMINSTIDGKIYGLPNQYSNTTLAYYNTELWKQAGFTELPKTFEEVMAAKPKFDEMGVSTIAFGTKNKWPVNSSYLSAIGDRYTGTEWTKSIIAGDGAKFTDPEFVSALNMLSTLGKSGVFNADYLSIVNQQAQALYGEGKAAMLIEGYWAVSYLDANAKPEVAANTTILPLPTVAGAKGAPNAVATGCGWFFGVNGSLEGEKLKAAQELALYLCGQEKSEIMLKEYGQPDAVNVGEVDLSKFSHLTQELAKVNNMMTAVPIYDVNMEASVIDVMNNGIQEIFNGAKTPEQVAQEIQTEYEAILK